MAKATIQSVIDLGFVAAQFGNPANFTAATTGYVDTIIIGMALVVESLVGAATYAAASGLTLHRITEAEKYLTAAELTRRFANFNASKMSTTRTDVSVELENERLLKRADAYEALAAQHLQALGVNVEGSIAAGYVETTHFGAVA